MKRTQVLLLIICAMKTLGYELNDLREYYPDPSQMYAYPVEMQDAWLLEDEEILFQALDEAANSSDPSALSDLIDGATLAQDAQNRQALVVKNDLPAGSFVLSFDEGPSPNTLQVLST